MAKTAEAVPQKVQSFARVVPTRTLKTKTLDVYRHANDDYTVTELVLEGPITGPVAVTGTRVLKEHCSGNVARDWVRDWYTKFATPNFTGPHW